MAAGANKEGPATSEFGLRRVLGLRDVVAIEVGQTIGAGVFVLTGLAITYCGGSLPLAYILAAVPIIFMFSAIAMLGRPYPPPAAPTITSGASSRRRRPWSASEATPSARCWAPSRSTR